MVPETIITQELSSFNEFPCSYFRTRIHGNYVTSTEVSAS